MTDLGSVRVGELVNTAMLATARSDQKACAEVLHTLMFEGTKVDCLAFTVGCLGKLASTMDANYGMSITKGEAGSEVQLLAALMLVDYMAGDMTQCYQRWLMADDDTAAGVVGFMMCAAGERMRAVWARLS